MPKPSKKLALSIARQRFAYGGAPFDEKSFYEKPFQSAPKQQQFAPTDYTAMAQQPLNDVLNAGATGSTTTALPPTATPQQPKPIPSPTNQMPFDAVGGGNMGGYNMSAATPDTGETSSFGETLGNIGSGIASAMGYGPGITMGNTIGGVLGGVVGTALAGPVGGFLGGMAGRHAANAMSTDPEQTVEQGVEQDMGDPTTSTTTEAGYGSGDPGGGSSDPGDGMGMSGLEGGVNSVGGNTNSGDGMFRGGRVGYADGGETVGIYPDPESQLPENMRGQVMRPADPTIRQRMADFLATAGGRRDETAVTRRFGEGLADVVGMTPIGIPMAYEETKRAIGAGNYPEAALSAVGMIPGAKPGAKAAVDTAKQVMVRNLKNERIPAPVEFYRGTEPGRTERITTGKPEWDSYLFVADNPKAAGMYGSSIQKYVAEPDAKILYEGTKDWQNIVGKWRNAENMLEYADRAARAAREAGYDAAWFKRQSDIGTSIFNPNKFKVVGDPVARDARTSETAKDVLTRAADNPRVSMDYKNVKERVPELTAGAKALEEGKIDSAEYQRLVNAHKPVSPWEAVPQPATYEEMYNALRINSRDKIGKGAEIPSGYPVGLRLDIPAYTNHGTWVPTIHDAAGGSAKVIAHEPVAMISDVSFTIPESKAFKVATGDTQKSPFAKIDGKWMPVTQQDAMDLANEAIKNPKEWRQVGMDPERHSYFYDRATQEPIISAEQVLQVGPLVLARNPTYGDKSAFKYKGGGSVTDRARMVLSRKA